MLLKIFNQGTGNGKAHIDYLFNEQKHKGFKPQLIKGNKFITEEITGSITNKNKYISGVIAFRENEVLEKSQLLDIIESFEATVAPFADKSRVNFLWVLHKDKNNTELHFISPRIELESRKALDIHPNTKTNLLLYEHFTRATNFKYGFEQVDKKAYFKSNFNFSKKLVRDLVEKRAVFFQSKYCEKKKNVYNKNTTPRNIKIKGKNNGMDKRNGTDNEGIIRTSTKSNNDVFSNRANTKNTIATSRHIEGFIEQPRQSVPKSDRAESQIIRPSEVNDFKLKTDKHSNFIATGSNQAQVLIASSLAVQLQSLTALYQTETNPLKRMQLFQQMTDLRYKLEIEQNAKKLEEQKHKKLKM
jgi:hypothetical protein